MHELKLVNIQGYHEDKKILDEVNLQLNPGEIGCLLGPSGCGKTTLLRSIAGLHALKGGEIYLDAKQISSKKGQLAPEKRNIGMVFQDYALFPHMTVRDNIAFGIQKQPKKEQQSRITKLLELVGLPGLEQRYPHELSGGQQQRIALARALAPRPVLLLMDEPFSGLDVELRETLASEVRQILKSEKITALMVTHNQHEAFAIADYIGVMKTGKLLQWGTAHNLYHTPKAPFIADFIGEGSFINGEVSDKQTVKTALGEFSIHPDYAAEAGQNVKVLIRPDNLIEDSDAPLSLPVQQRIYRGSHYQYELLLPSSEIVLCQGRHLPHDNPKTHVQITPRITNAIIFPS